MIQLDKQTILGVGVTSSNKEEILQYITTSLSQKGDPYYIVTPNPEIFAFASKHKAFQDILNQARIALPDGVGVMMASKVLGKQLHERITGIDLLDTLCGEVSGKPITVGFLGGRGGVALKTAECLKKKYPGLCVGFVGEEWDESANSKWQTPIKSGQIANGKEKNSIKETIGHTPYAISHVDILFVAFGFPKQEEWMAAHIGKARVKVMMGVGGAFDSISGRIPRAPYMLRRIGLEWLYRLYRQPWRIKRQLAIVGFLFLLVRARIRS